MRHSVSCMEGSLQYLSLESRGETNVGLLPPLGDDGRSCFQRKYGRRKEMKGSDGTLKILRVKGQEGEEGPAQETQQEWEK